MLRCDPYDDKIMTKAMKYKKAVKINAATIGIQSNVPEHLPQIPGKIEVKSLLTDFHSIKEIPFSTALDGHIIIEETEEPLHYTFNEATFHIKGALNKAAQKASDLRYSLWGNLGLLYRMTLYLLEKKHNILSLHACALYDDKKNSMYIIIGGAGSGKTVYLLSGLSRGLKLYSTETVHFQYIDNKVTLFIGSLIDNVRFGTLMYDFPEFQPSTPPPPLEKVWQEKIALDLSTHKTEFLSISDPLDIHLLFPHVEAGRKEFISSSTKPIKAAKLLFDNISQKITESFVLYDSLAVTGFEEPKLAARRLHTVSELVHHPQIVQMTSILSNPQDCWGNILK